jgi:hypothetical protein
LASFSTPPWPFRLSKLHLSFKNHFLQFEFQLNFRLTAGIGSRGAVIKEELAVEANVFFRSKCSERLLLFITFLLLMAPAFAGRPSRFHHFAQVLERHQ